MFPFLYKVYNVYKYGLFVYNIIKVILIIKFTYNLKQKVFG